VFKRIRTENTSPREAARTFGKGKGLKKGQALRAEGLSKVGAESKKASS